MVMAIDIGNTNVKIGFFDQKGQMAVSFKMSTDIKRTSDEYLALLLQLMHHAYIHESQIDGAIISSVIPQLDYTFCNVINYAFGVKPLIVGVGVKTGIAIRYDFPRELGSDRIITCVAAEKQYGAPFILVDFGTATTFNVVNDKTVESLSHCTAKLPSVDLDTPQKTVAQSTAKAIQSGVIFGAVGQVKYVVERIKPETGLSQAKVIATGGLANIVNAVEPIFDHIDRELSLKGLYEIYKINQ